MNLPAALNFEMPFALRALKARNFRFFFVGQFVSLTGSWITSTANFWLIYELTGRNVYLGLSAFFAQIPALFLSPFAGVLVDRWNLRRTLLITQSCSATQSILLAVLAWTGVLSGMPLVMAILLLQLLQGIINSFDLPARQSFSIQMVDRREDLPNAIALNSMIVNLSRFVGPGLGGILLAVGAAGGSLLKGPALCYTFDACSYLAVLLALYVMRPRPIGRTPRGGRYLSELAAGISYIRQHTVLRTVLISMFATSFFGVAFNTQLASIAKSHLGVGPQGYGYLFASVGVGATLSAAFLATRRTTASLPRLISYASVLLAAALLAMSMTTNYAALVLTGIMGMSMILQSASTNTMCQTLAGDQMRGRVMSFFTMSFMGTVPLGALAVGQLVELLGLPWTMRLCAGGLLAVSLLTGPVLRRAEVGGAGSPVITP